MSRRCVCATSPVSEERFSEPRTQQTDTLERLDGEFTNQATSRTRRLVTLSPLTKSYTLHLHSRYASVYVTDPVHRDNFHGRSFSHTPTVFVLVSVRNFASRFRLIVGCTAFPVFVRYLRAAACVYAIASVQYTGSCHRGGDSFRNVPNC